MGHPIKQGDFESALKKKGFEAEAKKQDHRWYRLYLNGQRTLVTTRVSHQPGTTDIRDQLISKIAREMHLSVPDLRRFVDCSLSADDYAKLMASK